MKVQSIVMSNVPKRVTGPTYPVQYAELLVLGLHLVGLPVVVDFDPGNWFVLASLKDQKRFLLGSF